MSPAVDRGSADLWETLERDVYAAHRVAAAERIGDAIESLLPLVAVAVSLLVLWAVVS